MYRLLVVDDEEFICRGIAQCIDWQSIGVGEVETAFDGELALEKMKTYQPDVMLVDLVMPFMDGLELSCQVMQKYPKVKIIILSASRDFQYAREAIRMNVEEYLTKPFEDEDVLAAVSRALRKLEHEQAEEKQIFAHREEQRARLLTEWLTQGLDEENLRQVEAVFGDKCHQVYFCAGILFVSAIGDDASAMVDDELATRTIWAQVQAAGLPSSVYAVCHVDKLYFAASASDAESAADTLEALGRRITEQVIVKQPCYVTFTMGTPYLGVERAFLSCMEAKRAGAHRGEYGNGAVYRLGAGGEEAVEESFCQLDLRQSLSDLIIAGEREKAAEAVAKQFAMLDSAGVRAISRIQMMAFELLTYLCRHAYGAEQYEQQLGHLTAQFGALQRLLTPRQVQDWLQARVDEIMDALEEKRGAYGVALLSKAEMYIREHYPEPELSLVEVAEHVNVSVSYLSALFRDYQHTNYSAYLTQVRLEQAKRLLALPQVKLFEVAFKVGYNSQQYFSTIFKKNLNCTPSEYRAKFR